MASSRLVPTARAPPSVIYTTPSERHPFKEVGGVRTVAQEATPALPRDENSEAIILEHEEKVNKYQDALAAYLKAKHFFGKASDKGGRSCRPHCAVLLESRLSENWFIREAQDLDHEEKVNKYQAMLATRLKTKYFSSNTFDKGLTGEMVEEITIESETIRMSRWPFTSLFADPAKFCLEKRSTYKTMCPSLTAASSAVCIPPSLAGETSKK